MGMRMGSGRGADIRVERRMTGYDEGVIGESGG